MFKKEKNCKECGILKPREEFLIDGLSKASVYCRDCYVSEKERKLKYYYKCATSEEYKRKERERILKYRNDNKEKVNKQEKERIKRKVKEDPLYWKKEWIKRKKYKRYGETANKRYRERYKSDSKFKLYCLIRVSIKKGLKRKTMKTNEILGCSFDEFKIYLENKFESWMTWENQGLYNGEFNYGWDIDHIEPLFPNGVERSDEDIIRLNHYTNLQPLCSKLNRDIKKNNI